MAEATPAVSASAFEILVGEPSEFDSSSSLLAAEGNIVRFIRGSKIPTRGALFDELAAALQFPRHFGNNWDALADCLTDLDWLGIAFGYYIVIWDADQFLADDPQGLAEFVGIVADAHEAWTSAQRKLFKVVLQVPKAKAELVKANWGGLVGKIAPSAHDAGWD